MSTLGIISSIILWLYKLRLWLQQGIDKGKALIVDLGERIVRGNWKSQS